MKVWFRLALPAIIGLLVTSVNVQGQLQENGLPTLSFTNLQQFIEHFTVHSPAGEWVGVQGTVVYQREERSVFIEDASAGLYANTTVPQPMSIGDQIEVRAQVSRTGFSPILRNASFRKIGRARLIPPKLANFAEALQGKYDMQRIRIQGRLTGVTQRAAWHYLHLAQEKASFLVEIDSADFDASLDELEIGSTLEISGICTVQAGEDRRIRSFQIILAAPGDVKIIQPAPWWNLRRSIWFATALTVCTALSLAWVGSLRYQVRKKTSEIAELNRNLESKVEQRTEALEAANREMEAFGYTVSHDLKAPARAISIMAQDLEESIAAKLAPDERTLFQRIQHNAKKMSDLIDNLLCFSRVNKTRLRMRSVDMNDLISSTYEELKPGHRELKWIQHELVPSDGDPQLIRQAVTNLLSNAIKFTQPRQLGIIEVGSEAGSSENVYFIKDNGVGFDMKHADRLFNVFERLHSENEFEGTGAGLAIAQRIIARHKGRIWAESTLGEGATFWFSLPAHAESP